jgi:cytochrome c
MKRTIHIALAAVSLIVVGHAQADEAMAKAKGCTVCHAVDKKVIGPAYKDVAAKYKPADVATLVKKVREGGTGVWGNVPMTPNKATVSEEEATTLVKWILTLK